MQQVWKDDAAVNSMLRARFREEKKERKAKEEERNRVRNFGLELVGELELEDVQRARTTLFRGMDNYRQNRLLKRECIRSESIFKKKEPAKGHASE